MALSEKPSASFENLTPDQQAEVRRYKKASRTRRAEMLSSMSKEAVAHINALYPAEISNPTAVIRIPVEIPADIGTRPLEEQIAFFDSVSDEQAGEVYRHLSSEAQVEVLTRDFEEDLNSGTTPILPESPRKDEKLAQQPKVDKKKAEAAGAAIGKRIKSGHRLTEGEKRFLIGCIGVFGIAFLTLVLAFAGMENGNGYQGIRVTDTKGATITLTPTQTEEILSGKTIAAVIGSDTPVPTDTAVPTNSPTQPPTLTPSATMTPTLNETDVVGTLLAKPAEKGSQGIVWSKNIDPRLANQNGFKISGNGYKTWDAIQKNRDAVDVGENLFWTAMWTKPESLADFGQPNIDPKKNIMLGHEKNETYFTVAAVEANPDAPISSFLTKTDGTLPKDKQDVVFAKFGFVGDLRKSAALSAVMELYAEQPQLFVYVNGKVNPEQVTWKDVFSSKKLIPLIAAKQKEILARHVSFTGDSQATMTPTPTATDAQGFWPKDLINGAKAFKTCELHGEGSTKDGKRVDTQKIASRVVFHSFGDKRDFFNADLTQETFFMSGTVLLDREGNVLKTADVLGTDRDFAWIIEQLKKDDPAFALWKSIESKWASEDVLLICGVGGIPRRGEMPVVPEGTPIPGSTETPQVTLTTPVDKTNTPVGPTRTPFVSTVTPRPTNRPTTAPTLPPLRTDVPPSTLIPTPQPTQGINQGDPTAHPEDPQPTSTPGL